MIDEDKGVYTIGTVASFIAEHPENLRVGDEIILLDPIELTEEDIIRIMIC